MRIADVDVKRHGQSIYGSTHTLTHTSHKYSSFKELFRHFCECYSNAETQFYSFFCAGCVVVENVLFPLIMFPFTKKT